MSRMCTSTSHVMIYILLTFCPIALQGSICEYDFVIERGKLI